MSKAKQDFKDATSFIGIVVILALLALLCLWLGDLTHFSRFGAGFLYGVVATLIGKWLMED